MKILLIALGGSVGAVLRFAVTAGAQRLTGTGFPVGTLTVNLAGCLAVGYLGTLMAGGVIVREEVRIALLVGFLGAFTTYSTFGFETFAMIEEGAFGRAGLYVLSHNIFGLVAVWAGYRIATL